MALKGPYEFSRSNFCRKMRSGVERGAERNVHERDTQSCGELFFGPASLNYEKFQKNLPIFAQTQTTVIKITAEITTIPID